jgi:hypothetical protein
MGFRKETFTESAVWLWSQHDQTPDGGTVQAINIIFKKNYQPHSGIGCGHGGVVIVGTMLLGYISQPNPGQAEPLVSGT